MARHLRQPGEKCGTCISFTPTPQTSLIVGVKQQGYCDCGPPSASPLPQRDETTGEIVTVNFTPWPVPVMENGWCGQWEPHPEQGNKPNV